MVARQSNELYWAQRMKNMEEALLDRSYEYVENLNRQFDVAIREIEKDISTWYQRFADNNEISLAEAKKWLAADELEELHWSVEEYIKHGEKNAIDGAWMKQLENASAKVHISRLDSLKLQLQQQAEVLYGNQLDNLDDVMRQSYTDGYYHTAFEFQKGIGVGWSLHALGEDAISKVLSRPWTADGQTFRDRCWTNKQDLVNTVNQELTRMIIRGEAPDQVIRTISQKFNVSRQKAGRLVMTESAYFSNAAQKDCFKALDVEQYRIIETMDSHTCGLCGSMDGKVFKMSEYETGVTAPPFHPWCRGCTAPYFADMDGIGERYARDIETGERYMVHRDMTYEEWKKSLVNKDDKAELQKATPKTVKQTEPEPVKRTEPVIEPEPVKAPERVYKELTEEEFKAIKQSITKAERKIIYGRSHLSGYINSSNARKINELLRNGKELPADYREIAITLKGVIGRNQLPDNILVTRYVKADALEGMFGISVPQGTLTQKPDDFWEQIEELPNLLGSGKVYTEKGFLSTSGVIDRNVMADKIIRMDIKAPKGTHAYVTTNYRESEIIFGPNTSLYLENAYIENPRQSDWKIVLECEIR